MVFPDGVARIGVVTPWKAGWQFQSGAVLPVLMLRVVRTFLKITVHAVLEAARQADFQRQPEDCRLSPMVLPGAF